MKDTLVSLLLIFALAPTALATAQIPDTIVYKGEEFRLHTNPMEPYFKAHPEKKPSSGVVSTALWRGYVATFEIRDNSLFLTDIEIQTRTEDPNGERRYEWKSVLRDLVPDGRSLKVEWFTGLLVLPHGKLVNYVHMGYGSTYSHYILLEIKQGNLTGERRLDHAQYEQFREKQFQAYKKTEAYRKTLAEMKEKGRSQEFVDSFLRSFILEYTSEFLEDENATDEPGAVGQAEERAEAATTAEAGTPSPVPVEQGAPPSCDTGTQDSSADEPPSPGQQQVP